MTIRFTLIGLLALAATALAVPAHAQSESDRYTIMVPEKRTRPEPPEPWLPPKYKSPHGTRQHVVVPRPARVARPRATVPPSLYVPETGRTLPNLPTVSGSGAGGSETYQDRAARCAHQASVYGSAVTGDRNAYIGGCINQ
ncbi:MAG: hypothetical protein ACREB8_04545 [Pseudolabrys sp.]